MLSEQTGGALGERVLFVLFCELSNLNDAERSQQGGMAWLARSQVERDQRLECLRSGGTLCLP